MQRVLKSARHHGAAVCVGVDGQLSRGSGVVVWRSKNKRQALVLTCNHNLPDSSQLAQPHIKVDGKHIRVTSVVARNEAMDYALLEVKLPRRNLFKWIKSGLRCLLRRKKPVRGAKLPKPSALASVAESTGDMDVYMAGYKGDVSHPVAGLRAGKTCGDMYLTHTPPVREGVSPQQQKIADMRASATYGAIVKRLIKAGVAAAPLSETYFSVRGVAQNHFVPTRYATYNSGPGFSGAPVYSAKSHEVLGLHFGNTNEGVPGISSRGAEVAFILPSKMIVRDLAIKMSAQKISKRFQSQVNAVLQQSGADSQMKQQWGL